MNIKELIGQQVIFLDGGMGTMLQSKGLDPGDPPERFNVINPNAVKEVHTAYLEAGSNVVLTNTFGANRLNYSAEEAEQLICAGIDIAREAISGLAEPGNRFVGLDIGPSGQLMEPYGDLSFEDAVDIFAEMIKAGVKHGVDLIVIETMSDLYETKAALLAAKENSDLPVFVSNTYQQSGRLMTGADPLTMIVMLEGLGADAVGMNCSVGPEQLTPVAETYLKYASVPVLVKPNAGLPRMDGDRVAYDITADTFACLTAGFAKKGAKILGGCCGTTPEYISLLVKNVSENAPAQGSGSFDQETGAPATETGRMISSRMISSHMTALSLDELDLSSVPRLEGATVDELVDSAYDEEDEADVLLLDTSNIAENEKAFLEEAVFEIQSAVRNPLMITARDPEALEAALRVYKGKALIRPAENSGDHPDILKKLVDKYGGIIC